MENKKLLAKLKIEEKLLTKYFSKIRNLIAINDFFALQKAIILLSIETNDELYSTRGLIKELERK